MSESVSDEWNARQRHVDALESLAESAKTYVEKTFAEPDEIRGELEYTQRLLETAFSEFKLLHKNLSGILNEGAYTLFDKMRELRRLEEKVAKTIKDIQPAI